MNWVATYMYFTRTEETMSTITMEICEYSFYFAQ